MTITVDQIFTKPNLDNLNGLLDPNIVKRADEIRRQKNFNEKLENLRLDLEKFNVSDRNKQALRRARERYLKKKMSEN
ncbi:MAG: hypothetical protein EBS55_09455 [Flavobacteriaceae bacterium]|nr:hypothetical protein [Flavobacteriaceae bacterium]